MRPTTASTTDTPDGVGTILVNRQPFSDAELDTLDRETSRLQFEVPFSPRVAHDQTFAQLTTPAGPDELAAFLRSYPVNITAPTDDSPFFFNMLRLRDIGRTSLLDFGNLSHNMKAVATLGILCVTVAVLTGLCILLPLWMTRDRVSLSGVGPLFTFFIAIGLGFMLIETSQMQRLIIALGHPTYGLSVVLFALLLSSGIGSFLTQSVTANTARGVGPTSPAGARADPRGVWRGHTVCRAMDRAHDHPRPNPGGGTSAVSGRAVHGDGVPARHEAGVGTSARADAVVLGSERRSLRAGLGARRVHCADVVDLDRVLDGMVVLPARAVRFRQGRPSDRWRRRICPSDGRVVRSTPRRRPAASSGMASHDRTGGRTSPQPMQGGAVR